MVAVEARAQQRSDPSRLIFIISGDVYVSLAPVLAGFLVIFTERSVFDPIIAGAIAVWIIFSTAREVFGSREELIWPEKIVCGHFGSRSTGTSHRLESENRCSSQQALLIQYNPLSGKGFARRGKVLQCIVGPMIWPRELD